MLSEKEKNQLLESLLHSLSGATASCISTLILYPLENLKTRKLLEQQRKQENSQVTKDMESQQKQQEQQQQQEQEQKQEKKQKQIMLINIIQIVKKIKNIKEYYQGITSMLLGNSLSYGTYFFFYELLKYLPLASPLASSLNSLIAGCLTTLFTNPFWVVNTRMTTSHQSFIYIVNNIVKEEGWQALFKGLGASLWLVSNPVIQFWFYEKFKKMHGSQYNNKYNSFLVNFFSGAVSKAIATIITFPYIVIRTYLQNNKTKSLTTLQVVQQILKAEGIKGFFTGIQYKLSQTVLNAAFLLSIYERIFIIFQQQFRFKKLK